MSTDPLWQSRHHLPGVPWDGASDARPRLRSLAPAGRSQRADDHGVRCRRPRLRGRPAIIVPASRTAPIRLCHREPIYQRAFPGRLTHRMHPPPREDESATVGQPPISQGACDATCDVFRDGAPVQAGPPGDRRDGHPLLVQLQYHDQLRQPDHPSPPPTHRRRGGLSPDAVPTGPTQPALGVPPAYRDVGFPAARSGENSPGDDTVSTSTSEGSDKLDAKEAPDFSG